MDALALISHQCCPAVTAYIRTEEAATANCTSNIVYAHDKWPARPRRPAVSWLIDSAAYIYVQRSICLYASSIGGGACNVLACVPILLTCVRKWHSVRFEKDTVNIVVCINVIFTLNVVYQ